MRARLPKHNRLQGRDTALIRAVGRDAGRVECVRLLLAAGANPNAVGEVRFFRASISGRRWSVLPLVLQFSFCHVQEFRPQLLTILCAADRWSLQLSVFVYVAHYFCS
jgi:hypothetical protein